MALTELIGWLNSLPLGSKIICVETSIWGDDAAIVIETPDGKVESRDILGTGHGSLQTIAKVGI